MARRGNEPATVNVRPHAFVGAVLLALAPLAALLRPLAPSRLDADLPLLLLHGGLTLVVQAVALWYLPSFAKRGVVTANLAGQTGPILFPAAAIGAVFDLGGLRQAAIGLGLGLFAITLVATVLVGPKWRTGVPFWRAPGRHRHGDRAALAAFALAAAWLLAAAARALTMRSGATVLVSVGWSLGLGLFVLGALAHLAPRSRGSRLAVAPFVAGLVASQVGALLLVLRPGTPALDAIPPLVDPVLLAGLVACGVAAFARESKPAGPRLREARPFLTVALVALALAVAILVAGYPATGPVVAGYLLFTVALALGIGGVALLALPVVFNQTPATRFVVPAAATAGAGLALLVASMFLPVPRLAAYALLGAALYLWLAVMAPLRTPRRECVP